MQKELVTLKQEELMIIFPEIAEIKGKKLKELTVKALLVAIDKGGWHSQNISKAPVTMNWKTSCTLIEHIRKVTQACIADYNILNKFYKENGVEFDRDTVICGALLHDIGKFTEFSLKGGKVIHSENSNLMRHPLSGAIIAAGAGLPDKIVHLIATHSFEGEKSNQTAESYFVRSIDDFVFKCTVYGLPKITK